MYGLPLDCQDMTIKICWEYRPWLHARVRFSLPVSNSRMKCRGGLLAATVITAIAGSLIYRDRLDLDSLVTWIASSGAPAPLIFIAARTLGAVILIPGSVTALETRMLDSS